MCGILFYLPKSGSSIPKNLFTISTKLQRHRGPDDLQIKKVGSGMFGFVRLSIVDLSNAAHQPIKFNNITGVINGELYNYIELKEELQKLGYTFKSNGDSEVFMAAISHWGINIASKKFRGMYAAVIYDSQANSYSIIRDRFGIKPLYYFENEGKLIISSEIKSILSLLNIPPSIKKRTIHNFIYKGFLDNDLNTFYSNIFKFPPASHATVVSNNSLKFIKYWQPEFSESKIFDPDELFEILDETMNIHLRSDVKISLALSGGIDSTIISKYASKIKHVDFISTSHSSSGMYGKQSTEAGEIEKKNIDKTVSYYGLKHRYVNTNDTEKIDTLKQILEKLDEPIKSATTIYQFGIRKAAADSGSKVMLTGDGSDEIFAGYPKCIPPYMADLISSHQYFYFLKSSVMLSHFYGFSPLQLIVHTIRYLRQTSQYNNYLKKMLMERLFISPMPYWLRIEDGISSAVSLETRVPFIDHKLYDYASSVKFQSFLKCGKNKTMLRQATKRLLPPHINNQSIKMGRPGNENSLIFGTWKETAVNIFKNDRSFLLPDDNVEKYILDSNDGKNVRFWFRAFLAHYWIKLLKEKHTNLIIK
jgi:asparagine synthase (glutamine-hydrolysing)